MINAFPVCLVLLLAYNASLNVAAATEDYIEEPAKTKLVEITSLGEHCEKNVCSDFHFDNVSEVAFFDLKAQVRISDEQPSTYELSSSLEYNTLIFQNSTFANFPLHFFYSLWVKELDMRSCGIERLTWENFLMSGDLSILLLSNNRIEYIEEMTFNYATELQYLFLDSNRIQRLVSESFKGLTKLKFLDLHDNQLKQLPAGVFDHFPNLHELNLAQNQLHALSGDIFAEIPNLLTLLLNSNNLREVDEYVFQRQRRLMLLDISLNSQLEVLAANLSAYYLMASNCSLTRVNIYGAVQKVDLRHNRLLELYFSQPQSLESLDLSNNALQQIASLSRAINLISLDLSNNPDLGSLPDPWTVKSLERLDLSNTGMTDLPVTALASLEKLRYLNISSNRIREINPRNFQYLEQLTHFYIHNNEWNCFNLKMLMDILIQPYKMIYTRDNYDANFPGEYINDIACMYRLPDVEQDSMEMPSQNFILLSAKPNDDPLVETKNLRKELKAIVAFYEEKFSKAFSMIMNLKQRLDMYEKMNETVWQQITITT